MADKKFELGNLAKLDIKNILQIRPDLNPQNQRILGFLILAIAVVIAFTWIILPTNSKVVKLNQELKSERLAIESLKIQISTMKMDSERLDKLRDRLNALVGVQKKGAEFNLADYTTFSVLKSIVRMAVISGCVVEDVRPQASSQVPQTPSASSQSISLRKKIVQLNVRGEYPSVKRFIGRLVDFPGLVSIEEAHLEREAGDQGEYVAGEFQIVIYGVNY